MSRLAIVAEGFGDVAALPSLISRTAAAFGLQVFAPHVVRAGTWARLRQSGQLERFCKLAGSHSGVDKVVVVVDLDDDCAKLESVSVAMRLKAIEKILDIPVGLCFCVREFETWFLEGLEGIKENSPEINWGGIAPDNPLKVRGAKEKFERLLGSKYRETIDQEKFSKRIDPRKLFETSRSFRKFVKEICHLDYDDLSSNLNANV